MEFSSPEYWRGSPFSSPRDLLNPRIEPGSPILQLDSLPTELSGKPGTFLECHVDECIYYPAFWNMFLSLSIVCLRFIHIVDSSKVCSFLLLSSTPLYRYTTLSLHSLVEEYLSDFWFLVWHVRNLEVMSPS